MKALVLLILLSTLTQALTLSTRETSPTPNESQVRLFIQDDSTLSINEPFKAYYYIKGSNLKVVDNYTPYCELSVEEITDSISRVVLDYTKSYDQIKDKEVIPHTTAYTYRDIKAHKAISLGPGFTIPKGEVFNAKIE